MLIRLASGPYDVPALGEGVTVLPQRYKEGSGLYPHGSDQLVKELRADGVPAVFLDPAAARRWQKLLGGDPVLDLFFGVVSGFIGTALWAAFTTSLERILGKDRKVKVTLVRQRIAPDGATRNEWIRYDGHVSGLAEIQWPSESNDV